MAECESWIAFCCAFRLEHESFIQLLSLQGCSFGIFYCPFVDRRLALTIFSPCLCLLWIVLACLQLCKKTGKSCIIIPPSVVVPPSARCRGKGEKAVLSEGCQLPGLSDTCGLPRPLTLPSLPPSFPSHFPSFSDYFFSFCLMESIHKIFLLVVAPLHCTVFFRYDGLMCVFTKDSLYQVTVKAVYKCKYEFFCIFLF